jgi:hypothetical protein
MQKTPESLMNIGFQVTKAGTTVQFIEPVQTENMGAFSQILLKIRRHKEQSIKPGTGCFCVLAPSRVLNSVIDCQLPLLYQQSHIDK